MTRSKFDVGDRVKVHDYRGVVIGTVMRKKWELGKWWYIVSDSWYNEEQLQKV